MAQSMMTRFLRLILIIAALMTALGSWIFLVPDSGLAEQYDLPADVPVLYRALVSFMLAVFAGLYAWMAAQARLIRPLLWLGVAGKGGAFLMVVALYATDQVSTGVVSLMIGDGVLSTIWLVWLLRTREVVGVGN
ncbi:MAG: hypothetical protein AAF545_06075 [Pseudomonadota bacterium]